MMAETQNNLEKYMTLIKTLDPDLYQIKIALVDTRVNPLIVPRIIRAIANISYGTGYGNVKISISQRGIAQITAVESEMVDEPAILLDIAE